MRIADAFRGLRAPAIEAAYSTPATSPTAAAGSPAPWSSPWADSSHLEELAKLELYGADVLANLPMTRSEAMSLGVVSRSRNLICHTGATVPMTGYTGRRHTPASWVSMPEQPAWIDQTDGPLSPYHRALWTFDDLFFYGWSLWVLRRAGGLVVSAARVAFDRWGFDENGHVTIDGKVHTTVPGFADVLLIPGPHDGLLNYARRSVRHASKILRAAEIAAETPSPNLELHQTSGPALSQSEIDTMVSTWAKARRGVNGGVGFTSQGIELKEHGSFEEHLLVDGRAAAAVDLARACNVPASEVDAVAKGGSLVYQTVRDNAKRMVDTGVGPFLSALSGATSQDGMTPRGAFVAYDLEAWLGPMAAVDDTAAAPAADTEDPAA